MSNVTITREPWPEGTVEAWASHDIVRDCHDWLSGARIIGHIVAPSIISSWDGSIWLVYQAHPTARRCALAATTPHPRCPRCRSQLLLLPHPGRFGGGPLVTDAANLPAPWPSWPPAVPLPVYTLSSVCLAVAP